MPPLNPFLAAFFRSSLPSQCTPTAHHILLVPTTDVLLTSRDTESSASVSDTVGSEEFLGSHVLRIPSAKSATAGGKDVHNLREIRGKARSYNTINGRSVVVKDSLIYSNKGESRHNHATCTLAAPPILILWDRLQGPRSRKPLVRRYMVFRYPRAKIMASLLHLATAGGIMGGDQSYTGFAAELWRPGLNGRHGRLSDGGRA